MSLLQCGAYTHVRFLWRDAISNLNRVIRIATNGVVWRDTRPSGQVQVFRPGFTHFIGARCLNSTTNRKVTGDISTDA